LPSRSKPPATPPQHVAGFLMRALFTMFAEDVGLLPKARLHRTAQKPQRSDLPSFAPMLESLWQTMNKGGFSHRHPRQRAALQRRPVPIQRDRRSTATSSRC
jgi:hypothetical protein